MEFHLHTYFIHHYHICEFFENLLQTKKSHVQRVDFHVCEVALPIKPDKSYLSCHIWSKNSFSLCLFPVSWYVQTTMKNTKCNVLYIFTFCSILTKGSSEKYTTDIKFIYYINRTYLFGSILVYGSLLFFILFSYTIFVERSLFINSLANIV
jgi:hypothetical protein